MTEQEEFANMTMVEKINTIDKVIEENIRGFLQKDNGDVELLNVVERHEYLMVYVEYQGACVSCESSGNTLASMETILQRMLAPNIRVISL
ncbi:MAG: Iron-sulfur cluster assembly scaffold protein IscU/NifU-like [uncultured Sulfurovum sp.]|uniref:Iron-sulfur cluster assembly scaffold protein IscU/NifU-like n=1 Tax=uncultured Sulfurovum sp. TaxID=269237 RepID=A0A6S6S0W2_9BACT|nr:MAG: Iron-sulfur cluster assembly scaffold protein IscU/NifU-like [uncultured Sulfurovum sp.]